MALYLGPILDGVTLNVYPPHVGYTPVVEEVVHTTPAFFIQTHRIGFRFKFDLSWASISLITESMWEQIRVIVNKNKVYFFTPFPDTYPNSIFVVKIIGGIQALDTFHYIGTGYQGSLSLETTIPVKQIPSWAA